MSSQSQVVRFLRVADGKFPIHSDTIAPTWYLPSDLTSSSEEKKSQCHLPFTTIFKSAARQKHYKNDLKEHDNSMIITQVWYYTTWVIPMWYKCIPITHWVYTYKNSTGVSQRSYLRSAVLKNFSTQKTQSQKPQYSKTAVLKNRSTQKPQYSKPAVLKI